MPRFDRYIGIDYSGAESPTETAKRLRVCVIEDNSKSKDLCLNTEWSRESLANWLIKRLGDGTRTLIGIDHGFSFPVTYFDKYGIKKDWDSFLQDFVKFWPTRTERVADIRSDKDRSNQRSGNTDWLRLTETRTSSAKSVFEFRWAGVAYSTHAGLPWLCDIRRKLHNKVHFWPFDEWKISENKPSAIVEVYPAIFKRRFPLPSHIKDTRAGDKQDAYAVARWLERVDQNGSLQSFLCPQDMTEEERTIGQFEGWILGVC